MSILLRICCLVVLCGVSPVSTVRADMMADSPVKFRARTASGEIPPDLPAKADFPGKKDYYFLCPPERSLAQIAAIQAPCRPEFTAPPHDWNISSAPAGSWRRRRIATPGPGRQHHQRHHAFGWVAKLLEAIPKMLRATVYVRGGGGCQRYKEEGRIAKYVIPRKPTWCSSAASASGTSRVSRGHPPVTGRSARGRNPAGHGCLWHGGPARPEALASPPFGHWRLRRGTQALAAEEPAPTST